MSGQEREALRAEFEARYEQQHRGPGCFARHEDGEYIMLTTRLRWEGFQAARAAQPAAPAVPAHAADGLPELPESAWHPAPHERAIHPVAAEEHGRRCFELGRQQAVPQGWKLVPAEPTNTMGHSGSIAKTSGANAREIYQEMLTAAPQAPADERRPGPGIEGFTKVVDRYVKPVPERRPLSYGDMEALAEKHAPPVHPDFTNDDGWEEFGRAVEQAQGITGDPAT